MAQTQTLIPIQAALNNSGVYSAYFETKKDVKVPYNVWRGVGQNTALADDAVYTKMSNIYEVEHHFKKKDETLETAIEDALIAEGFLYAKGEDLRDDETATYYVTYTVWR